MITVFTPTYNRAKLLPRLYKSLINQTNQNFEWLIVDDGSEDETYNLISELLKENKISIRYYKQKNSGKHIAINQGAKFAQGEYFLIVDSDDCLTPKSLEIFANKFRFLDNNIVSISARMVDQNNKLVGDDFKSFHLISDHIEKKYFKNIDGDLANLIKTNVLQKYPFPVITDQKYCAEGLIFLRMAKDNYKTLFTDEVVYVCEYQNSGLSKNSVENRRLSYKYATIYYFELLHYQDLPIFQKIRAAINYWRFFNFQKQELLIFKNFSNIYLFCCLPFGIIFSIKDKSGF